MDKKIKIKEIMEIFACSKPTAIEIRKEVAKKLKKNTAEVTKNDVFECYYLAENK